MFNAANTKYQETQAFIGWAKSHDLTTLQDVFNSTYWFHGSSENGPTQTPHFILRVEGVLTCCTLYNIYTDSVGYFYNASWLRI